jgi:hypothetical protein
MLNLPYTLDEIKQQARILHKEMKKTAINLSYMQVLQLKAKSLGFKNWETLEQAVLESSLVVSFESSTELNLNTEKSKTLWLGVKNISVYIRANDEGVSVDLYPMDNEDSDSLAGTSLSYEEASSVAEDNEGPG